MSVNIFVLDFLIPLYTTVYNYENEILDSVGACV